MNNEVMMWVIHTNVRRDPLQRVRDNGVPTGDVLDKSALYGVEQSRVPIHRARARTRRSLDTPALPSACMLAYN